MKAKLKKAFCNLYFVIARLFMCAGIMIWFVICAFGWITPIALQNDGYSTELQLISFAGWFVATGIGIYSLAKVVKISF